MLDDEFCKEVSSSRRAGYIAGMVIALIVAIGLSSFAFGTADAAGPRPSYKFKNTATSRCLDGTQGRVEAKVCNSADNNQRWEKYYPARPGTFVLRNLVTHQCLKAVKHADVLHNRWTFDVVSDRCALSEESQWFRQVADASGGFRLISVRIEEKPWEDRSYRQISCIDNDAGQAAYDIRFGKCASDNMYQHWKS